MEAHVLQIDTPDSFAAAVRTAGELLRAGHVVAVPTETVYGLAANALNAEAVSKIYQIKGRPAENPIIVHVASLDMARSCTLEWPDSAAALAAGFWPGPLTLVLPKAREIPPIVTAGGSSVGIRWPLHPFMQELIRACRFPLAAPSANPANQISPTSAAHVYESMKDRIPLIIDAGPSNVGIESTVLDLTVRPPRILRPGMVLREDIANALGCDVVEGSPSSGPLKSPGLLKRHYSPRARLVIRSWRNEAELLSLARGFHTPLESIHVVAHEVVPRNTPFGRVAIIPQDPQAYARALYQELHRCDELDAVLILVEALPDEASWTPIRDRLRRAAADPE
jgi:L-threonylcarbamoyladenylate synthase